MQNKEKPQRSKKFGAHVLTKLKKTPILVAI